MSEDDVLFGYRLQLVALAGRIGAIDICSSYAWAELVSCPQGQPNAAQTSKLAQRDAATSPTTSTTTTSSAPTPDASHTAASPATSSTPPAKWKRNEPQPPAHPGGCPV